MRKMRKVGRGLLWISGSPEATTVCHDCRDHHGRIDVHRRCNRDGSSYSIKSSVMLHLCETCAMRFVGDIVGMLESLTRERVDADMSQTIAQQSMIRLTTDRSHDRRVRARLKKLAVQR